VPHLDGPPFTLGVASGDPVADRVVLWTRLAPRPLEGGGMPDVPVPVEWQVATDERFGDVVARGVEVAEPRWGHSVHVDAGGLRPDARYWYRFRVGEHVSAVGRTRTAPAAGSAERGARLRFGFGSCQDWTSGLYTAYPHLVAEELDLMIWLGDYIYESGIGGESAPRHHDKATTQTLEDYRARYALYTGDPNLQAARAAQPWIVLWDDHEVANDYGGDADRAGTPAEQFRRRRAAAYQAWWENQPVRLAPPGADGSLSVARGLDWGGLARIHALDERQHRSARACAGSTKLVDDCPDRVDPQRSMLGAAPRDRFLGDLDTSRARWNLIANEVVMTRVRVAGLYNLDQWDGFAAEQRLVAERLARPDLNPLVLTGDIHAFAVADLKVDYDDPASPVVGTELVGGSISSVFPLPDLAVDVVRGLPDVHQFDGTRHGYAVVDLTADEARCRYRTVSTVTQPTADISTLAEMVVAAGRPGARLA
jgi:alkaline phosphatase D